MDLHYREEWRRNGNRLCDQVIPAVVVDIETDGLDNPTCIHVMACKDVHTKEERIFTHENWSEAQAYLDQYDLVIGHNFIHYDHRVLMDVGNVRIEESKVFDTLVLSQLLDAKRPGGHSLEEWGETLKFAKVEHDDWSQLSDAMIKRCKGDVELTHRVYSHLMKIVKRNQGAFESAIFIEMYSRWVARDMHENGFAFNIKDAYSMHTELTDKLVRLLELIRKSFPPRAKLVREITPKLTKFGTISKQGISNWYEGEDYTIFSEGCSFSLVEWVPFNPSSTSQIIERMWEAGWKPVEKTKGHEQAIRARDKEKIEEFKTYGWKVNEVNLGTLPEDAPEACNFLVEYILTDARRRTLEEWMSAYDEKDGRIHGRFNPLGTRTHRCSHTRPNMGNIANKKTIKYNSPYLRELAIEYGGRMRSMWCCDSGNILVGCDMESAHLRIFAHLIDDADFTQSLISGKKEDGSDPHSKNRHALGSVCVDRDRAKTFIFSFLNGAAVPKVCEIFACTRQAAKEALDRFVQAYPGLKRLKETSIPRDAARGYFEGVDGRLVKYDQEHGMIGMYLQNMESVLMKYANWIWRTRLDREGICYRQVNWVHDEFVTETCGLGAQVVAQAQVDSIRQVGALFGLRCPMGGEAKIGKTWLEVH